jgi:hypothetical protein
MIHEIPIYNNPSITYQTTDYIVYTTNNVNQMTAIKHAIFVLDKLLFWS